MPSYYDVFDHRELFIVGEVCNRGVNGVEGAYAADVGRILIVCTFEPPVSFIYVCHIIGSAPYMSACSPFHTS